MKRTAVSIMVAATVLATCAGYATAAPSTGAKAHSGVKGTVLFSPTCPVQGLPPDPRCAPRPGPADIRLLRRNGSLAAETMAGADGRFLVVVRPGHYGVEATTSAPGKGCEVTPQEVTVTTGSYVTVDVSCDTGIR